MERRVSFMSARLLTRCLAPAALLAAAMLAPGAARAAPPGLVARTYQVADLVIPVNNGPCVIDLKGGSAARPPAAPACTTGAAPASTLHEQLIQLVTSAVAPRSWADKGGPGTIDYHALSMSLVINQTPDIQEQIADLLAALRRLQDQEVAVEVRFINVAEDFCERVGVDFNSHPPQTHCTPAPCDAAEKGVAFLTDAQVRKLMEQIQGDRRTNVMQAPKMTLFNGQASVLRVGDEHRFVTGVDVSDESGQVLVLPRTETVTTGLEMGVQPVISADRRFVRLKLAVRKSELAANVPLFPVTVPVKPADDGQPVVFTQYIQQPAVNVQCGQWAVCVPDGGTVLLNGWKSVREARCEYGPPVLSKIPYVNRLYKNVGYGRETEHVLVLVTARVIVNEEEETKKPAAACPGPCPCDGPCACPCPAKCAAGAPCCAARCAAVKAKAAELMKHFNELYKEGRYEEAESCAAKAQEIDPDNAAVSAAVHIARTQAGCHHGAKCCGHKADAETVAELLREYHRACAKARQLAERALAIDPTCFSKMKGGAEASEKHGEE
jgi:hypothetical protein